MELEPIALLPEAGGRKPPEANRISRGPKDDHHFWHHLAGTRDYLLGVTVKSVLLRTQEHIVFLDEDTNVHWECSKDTEVRRCYPKIANRVASLEARSEFLRRAHSTAFLRMAGRDNDLTNTRCLIAQGIIQVFVGKPGADEETEKHANEVLDTAEAWIRQRANEVSRLWYFRPFSILFLVSFIVLLLFLTFFPKPEWALAYACVACGGIGAFISSAIGCARVPTAVSAGQRLHTLEAAIRWSVGLGAGALVYLLGRSNLVNLAQVSPLLTPAQGEYGNFAMLAVALLAGASERFFPSLIKKLDDPELKK
jgi:hypothetical protein